MKQVAGGENELRQDYIRTARVKGLTERAVVYKHALNNAIIPLVTLGRLDRWNTRRLGHHGTALQPAESWPMTLPRSSSAITRKSRPTSSRDHRPRLCDPGYRHSLCVR